MDTKRISVMIALVCLAGFFSGCGKTPQALPTERNSLILRFFESMARGDASAASEQGAKLMAMDISNDYIIKLVTVQQSNTFLQRAQREINIGNIDGALAVLNEGIKTYPSNRDLVRQRGRIRQLRNAKMLLDEMRNAKTSAAMSSALTAASTGLSSNMTPKLRAYFTDYRLQIDEVARREAAKTSGQEPEVKTTAPVVPPPPVNEP